MKRTVFSYVISIIFCHLFLFVALASASPVGEESERLYTKEEIVAPLKDDSGKNHPPAKLAYELPVKLGIFERFLVTSHKAKEVPEVIRLWKKVDDKYLFVREWIAEPGVNYFHKVRIMEREGLTLMHVPRIYVTETYIRTGINPGFHREDKFYLFTKEGDLDDIFFEYAPDVVKDKLAKGERVWKGPSLDIWYDTMKFAFYIGKIADNECCPKAGYVTGTYKFVRELKFDPVKKKDVFKLKILVDEYEREEVNHDI